MRVIKWRIVVEGWDTFPTGRIEASMAIEAYCVKCKAKKTMVDPQEGTTKNGKPIVKRKCPDCGTTICRIGAVK